MKKVYMLFSGALLASASFAQLSNIPSATLAQPILEIADPADIVSQVVRPSLIDDRASGDVIFEDNFDDAANWIVTGPSGADGTHNWVIGTETTWFLSGSNVINSTSGGNYAVCKNGDATEAIGTPLGPLAGGNFYMQLDSVLDLSGLPQALFQFEQQGARFNDIQTVEISDDGSAWYVIGDNEDRIASFLGAGGTYTNGELRQFNMSNVIDAEGLDASTISVRFHLTWGSAVTSPGITYGWFVDDVKVLEGFDADLRLQETYAVAGDFPVKVTRMPLTQIADVTFSGIVWNNGVSDVTGAKLNVDVPAASYAEASAGVDLVAGLDPATARDSSIVSVALTPTSSLGILTVDYSLDATEELENTFNDELQGRLRMTSDVMAADGYNGAQADITGSFFGWNAPSGFYSSIGNAVEVFEDGVIGGIEVGIRNYSNTVSSEGRLIFALIYKLNTELDIPAFEFEFQSTDYIISSSDVNGLAEIIFAEGLTVTAGEVYAVTAGYYNGTDSEVVIMTAGQSPIGTVFGADGETLNQLVGQDDTETTVGTPVVRTIFRDFTGVEEEATNSFSIGQNVPNPFGNTSVINYNLNETANVSVQFTDVSGKIVKSINKGSQTEGAHTLSVDANDFAEGVYFYTFVVGNDKVTKRMIITK